MFIDTGFLKNYKIQLKLEKTVEGNVERDWVPAYHFAICNDKCRKRLSRRWIFWISTNIRMMWFIQILLER